MAYEYRHLTSSARDVISLKQLLRVFHVAFDEQDTADERIPSDDYVRSLLEKPHIIVVVALDGERVIGGLVAYQFDKFQREAREIYLYDLAVAEEHRRKGVARQLIGELTAIARERRASYVLVQADPGDDPAIRLYTSLGTRQDVHHFDIVIDETPAS
jgi:aminoglycoside 3-N-acetyltransferase I